MDSSDTSRVKLRSCAPCAIAKRSCDHLNPCTRCVSLGIERECVVLSDGRKKDVKAAIRRGSAPVTLTSGKNSIVRMKISKTSSLVDYLDIGRIQESHRRAPVKSRSIRPGIDTSDMCGKKYVSGTQSSPSVQSNALPAVENAPLNSPSSDSGRSGGRKSGRSKRSVVSNDSRSEKGHNLTENMHSNGEYPQNNQYFPTLSSVTYPQYSHFSNSDAYTAQFQPLMEGNHHDIQQTTFLRMESMYDIHQPHAFSVFENGGMKNSALVDGYGNYQQTTHSQLVSKSYFPSKPIKEEDLVNLRDSARQPTSLHTFSSGKNDSSACLEPSDQVKTLSSCDNCDKTSLKFLESVQNCQVLPTNNVSTRVVDRCPSPKGQDSASHKEEQSWSSRVLHEHDEESFKAAIESMCSLSVESKSIPDHTSQIIYPNVRYISEKEFHPPSLAHSSHPSLISNDVSIREVVFNCPAAWSAHTEVSTGVENPPGGFPSFQHTYGADKSSFTVFKDIEECERRDRVRMRPKSKAPSSRQVRRELRSFSSESTEEKGPPSDMNASAPYASNSAKENPSQLQSQVDMENSSGFFQSPKRVKIQENVGTSKSVSISLHTLERGSADGQVQIHYLPHTHNNLPCNNHMNTINNDNSVASRNREQSEVIPTTIDSSDSPFKGLSSNNSSRLASSLANLLRVAATDALKSPSSAVNHSNSEHFPLSSPPRAISPGLFGSSEDSGTHPPEDGTVPEWSALFSFSPISIGELGDGLSLSLDDLLEVSPSPFVFSSKLNESSTAPADTVSFLDSLDAAPSQGSTNSVDVKENSSESTVLEDEEMSGLNEESQDSGLSEALAALLAASPPSLTIHLREVALRELCVLSALYSAHSSPLCPFIFMPFFPRASCADISTVMRFQPFLQGCELPSGQASAASLTRSAEAALNQPLSLFFLPLLEAEAFLKHRLAELLLDNSSGEGITVLRARIERLLVRAPENVIALYRLLAPTNSIILDGIAKNAGISESVQIRHSSHVSAEINQNPFPKLESILGTRGRRYPGYKPHPKHNLKIFMNFIGSVTPLQCPVAAGIANIPEKSAIKITPLGLISPCMAAFGASAASLLVVPHVVHRVALLLRQARLNLLLTPKREEVFDCGREGGCCGGCGPSSASVTALGDTSKVSASREPHEPPTIVATKCPVGAGLLPSAKYSLLGFLRFVGPSGLSEPTRQEAFFDPPPASLRASNDPQEIGSIDIQLEELSAKESRRALVHSSVPKLYMLFHDHLATSEAFLQSVRAASGPSPSNLEDHAVLLQQQQIAPLLAPLSLLPPLPVAPLLPRQIVWNAAFSALLGLPHADGDALMVLIGFHLVPSYVHPDARVAHARALMLAIARFEPLVKLEAVFATLQGWKSGYELCDISYYPSGSVRSITSTIILSE